MASKNKKMQLVFGDVTLGVHGEDFDYIFSYQTGGPESLVIAGMEWLYRTPKPSFWRATTDNDRGNGFPFRSAMWLGADLFIRCTDVRVKVDGKLEKNRLAPDNNRHSADERAEEVSIRYTYETATVPATNVRVKYTVTADGAIRVDVRYFGKEGLPELPAFGLRFVMPTGALGYRWHGLSGETYPDRMAGGIEGCYTADGLPVTPYVVPQDCGVHMETENVTIFRDLALANTAPDGKTHALKISACGKKRFAFSCLPYTPAELENATHHEELPPARRTVLTVLGAVRGVGGINSWGADVEAPYHISGEKDIRFSFVIEGAEE